MELINIDVVGFEQAQAGLEVPAEGLGGLRVGLGRQNHLAAHGRKRFAHLFLAVGIGARRVEKANAVVERLFQQAHRFLLAVPLNRQRAEAVAVHDQAGSSQFDRFHRVSLLHYEHYTAFRAACQPQVGGMKRIQMMREKSSKTYELD